MNKRIGVDEFKGRRLWYDTARVSSAYFMRSQRKNRPEPFASCEQGIDNRFMKDLRER